MLRPMNDPTIRALNDALNGALTAELVVEVQKIETLSSKGVANVDSLAARIEEEIRGIDSADLPHRSETTDGDLRVAWVARTRTSGDAAERG